MVKQFAAHTKYFGDTDATDLKSIAWRRELETRLRGGIRKQIRHNGGKPDDYDIEMIYYQSYEDGDMKDDSPQATMGAVYFPEPIFPNSLPVVLMACRATEKTK